MTDSQRMPPLERDAWTPEMRTMFTLLEGPEAYENGSKSNFILTLARHPQLATSFFKFNGRMVMKGLVPPRLREIAILRVAWLTRSSYEWAQHVRLSLLPDPLGAKQIEAFQRGEPADEEGEGLLVRAHIEAIKLGADHPIWSDAEREVLRAVDESRTSSRVCDKTWDGLKDHFSEAEVIELLFTIGIYAMMAFVLNSLDVQSEPAQRKYGEDMPTI